MSDRETLKKAEAMKKSLLAVYNDPEKMELGKFFVLRSKAKDNGLNVYLKYIGFGAIENDKSCLGFPAITKINSQGELKKISRYVDCEIVHLSDAVIENIKDLNGLIYRFEIQDILKDDKKN